MGLIDDLKNEGYDVSQITPELISSLEKEGYDTTSLKAPQQPEKSFLNKASDLNNAVQDKIGQVVGPVMPLIQKQMAFNPMMNMGQMADQGARTVANQTGEMVAEKGGAMGFPKTAAAIGTGIQMAPDVAEAAIAGMGGGVEAAGKGVENVAKPFVKAGKVITAPMKSTSEAAINAAEGAAGVELKAPITKQIAEGLGLPKNAQSFNDIVNVLNKTKPSEINPQVAKDFLGKAETVFKKPIGRTEKAALSKAVAKAREALNTQIPARAKPAAELRNAYIRSNIIKGVSGAGSVGAGLAYAMKMLRGR